MYEHLSSIGVNHLQIPAPSPSAADEVKAELDGYGFAAVALTAKYQDEDTTATDAATTDWMDAFDTATRMGVPLVHSSVKAHPGAESDVYNWLAKMGDRAVAHGITLVLETHPTLLHNGEVCLEMVRAVNHPAVRINFDTGNISFYTDGGDAVVELEKIAPYVACTHLKDHDGEFEAWHFRTLGEGIVDFAEVLRILKSVDYTGPYILQPEGVPGEELTEAQTKERIEKSFEHLRRLGYGD
jgi:inosose dehydratase